MTIQDKEATRGRGVDALIERFPEAVELWSGTIKTGSSQKITVTAFTIRGHLVLLVQRGKDVGNAWDVFVSASDAPEIAKTLDAVEVRVRA